MRKFISLLLAALMLLFSLTSCADNMDNVGDENTSTAPLAETTATPESEGVTNSLPKDLVFNGETVVFGSRDADFVRDEISVEEDDGDMLHSAIRKRNDDIENRFGITIRNEKITGNQYAVT